MKEKIYMAETETVTPATAATILGIDRHWFKRVIDAGLIKTTQDEDGREVVSMRAIRAYQRRDYITQAEAARRLGVTRLTVRRWLTSGRLAGERIGTAGHWHITAAAVETLKQEREERAS